jgi:DegV family protein with EDD domain
MVKIITDTTACLPDEIIQKYQIPVVPQVINFGTESFYEGREIDMDTFLRRLRSSTELPKTAAPPPELFVELFEQFIPAGEPILCIHPSAEVSGTVRSATVAARDFPEADIRIIDTRTVASTLGVMVEKAAQWAVEGKTADQIVQSLEQMAGTSRIFFLVDTLDYLAKGGRIGGASKLIGTLLQIKPILVFQNGIVDQYERERTQKRALQRVIQLVVDQIDTSGAGYPTVLHADAYAEAQQLSQSLAQILVEDDIPIYDMPPAIVTHAGPGVLGVGFFRPLADSGMS